MGHEKLPIIGLLLRMGVHDVQNDGCLHQLAGICLFHISYILFGLAGEKRIYRRYYRNAC